MLTVESERCIRHLHISCLKLGSREQIFKLQLDSVDGVGIRSEVIGKYYTDMQVLQVSSHCSLCALGDSQVPTFSTHDPEGC